MTCPFFSQISFFVRNFLPFLHFHKNFFLYILHSNGTPTVLKRFECIQLCSSRSWLVSRWWKIRCLTPAPSFCPLSGIDLNLSNSMNISIKIKECKFKNILNMRMFRWMLWMTKLEIRNRHEFTWDFDSIQSQTYWLPTGRFIKYKVYVWIKI